MFDPVLALIGLAVLIVSLYLTYYTAGKIAPKKRVGEKAELYACGERSVSVARRLVMSYYRYIIVFTLFDAAPIIIILAVSCFKVLEPIHYIILAVYTLVVGLACLVVAR